MSRIPRILCDRFRPATTHEIRNWSYGAVSRRAGSLEHRWAELRGTLEDPSIFGPRVDFECACQKYCGRKFASMVCDVCGVKITSTQVRRERFGHINLAQPLRLDLSEPISVVESFPVLPASIRESDAGRELNGIYEDLLEAGQALNVAAVHDVFVRICDVLVPVVTVAVQWNLLEAPVLAQGLGLYSRDDERFSALFDPV